MWETLLFLSRSLNFTFTIVRPPDGKWGISNEKGEWNGMLGMLSRREVDFALGPFGVIYERTQACDFSYPVVIDYWTTITPANLEQDPWPIVRPFQWPVWVGLLLSIPLFVTALTVADKIFLAGQNLPKAKIFQSNVGFTLRTALVEASPWIPGERNYNKIFALSWLLGVFVLSQSYSGTLISILTVPLLPTPIDSVDDLVTQSQLPWAIESGSILEQMGAAAQKGSTFSELYRGAELLGTCYDTRADIKAGSLAHVCERIGIRKLLSDEFALTGKCHFYVATENFLATSFAMAFQVLLQMGFHERWISTLMPNATSCDSQVKIVNSHGAGKASGLSLNQTNGLFLMLLIGLGSAAALFIAELLLQALVLLLQRYSGVKSMMYGKHNNAWLAVPRNNLLFKNRTDAFKKMSS